MNKYWIDNTLHSGQPVTTCTPGPMEKKSKSEFSPHLNYHSENLLRICPIIDHRHSVCYTVCISTPTAFIPSRIETTKLQKITSLLTVVPKRHSQSNACPQYRISHRWRVGVLRWIHECTKLLIMARRQPSCFCGMWVAPLKTSSLVRGFSPTCHQSFFF